MNEGTESEEMRPEYDFSRGVKGRYSTLFGSERERLVSSAAALDRQTWLAHSLLSFQDFEAHLVAYWSLALRYDPSSAGNAVSMLLERLDKKALRDLRRDLDKHTSVDEHFYDELRELINDRNWLVHKSFHSFSSSRLESITDRSTRLGGRLYSLLLERCLNAGMEEREVRERAAEVVEEWAADRNAA